MSDADSASPTPLRGRKGPSERSSRGPIVMLGVPAMSVSSSVEVWKISRCSGVLAASRRALTAASELARACAGPLLGELGGQLAQALEARAAPRVLLGRHQRAPARAQQLDQAGDERLGGERVQAGGCAALERGEQLDAFARLGGHLG